MPPELDPGAIRVVRPIEWRWMDDKKSALEMFDERLGRWSKYHAWVSVVLEGVERGEPFARLVDAVAAAERKPRGAADTMTRRLLYGLRQAGHLDLGFPPAPASFARDRYRVVRELGRGAVGIAFECEDAATGARVVVKQPWAFFTDLARASAHVRHEGDVLRALDHARIARFVRAFEGEGELPHVVRAFVDGAPYPLAPLGDADLRAFEADVADALAHVHARGFLLVDMLPSNFLRTKEGPVLVDVGLARAMPPEGARSDVVSFGRLLFTMATGVRPLPAWGEAELASRLGDHPRRERILALARGDARLA